MDTKTKIIEGLVITVLLAGVGLLVFNRLNKPEVVEETATSTPITAQNIEVTKIDPAKSGKKIPDGFPPSIPLEPAGVTDSYKAVYKDSKVTNYTLSYTSSKSRGDLWDQYSKYMRDEGYAVDTQASSRSLGQISGTKNNDTLAVIISSNGSVSLVQISYLDR